MRTHMPSHRLQMVAERTRFQGRIGDLEVLLAAANRTINERDEEIVGLRKEISDLNAQAKRVRDGWAAERQAWHTCRVSDDRMQRHSHAVHATFASMSLLTELPALEWHGMVPCLAMPERDSVAALQCAVGGRAGSGGPGARALRGGHP